MASILCGLFLKEVIRESVRSRPSSPVTSKKPYIRMTGSVSYNIKFDTVVMNVDRISHTYRSSGSLRLVLWLVTSFSSKNSWTGHKIAKVKLDSLEEDEYYHDLKKTAPRRSPPPGDYAVILSLEGLEDGKYVSEDHRVFDRRFVVTEDMQMIGNRGYTLNDDTVEIRAAKIDHNFGRKTGNLRLTLWASKQGVDSKGNWTGCKVAKCYLDPVKENRVLTDVEEVVSRRRVKPGKYWMILQLESFIDDDWVSHDYFQFDNKKKIKEMPVSSDSSSSDSSSSEDERDERDERHESVSGRSMSTVMAEMLNQ